MSRLELFLGRFIGQISASGELRPSTEDIEMAGEIQTILHRFYRGERLPKTLTISIGV